MRCIHTIPEEHLHMKGVGMPTVLFRGVNFGFQSHLGCSEGLKPSYIAHMKQSHLGFQGKKFKKYIFDLF